MPDNLLYYGDNLPVLRAHVPDESVDLVYLDPPFNSNQTYNVLFREKDGSAAAAQLKAFEDTWHWDAAAVADYQELVESGGKVSQALQAMRLLIGDGDMLAYLVRMAPRLAELRRVLKPTGSLYLHCDPTASHYLKALLDAIFGPAGYRNEIVWKRTCAHSSSKKFAPVHDVLLYYAKGKRPVWNEPRTDYDQEYLDKYYRFDDGDGRLYWRDNLCAAGVRHGRSGVAWHGIDPSAKGMHWKYTVERLEELDAEGRIYWPPGGTMPQYKRYRDELKGKAVSDIWDDIDRINPVGSERLGYPTQKPETLLERIIQASSNEGDTVLDPFCGCGTAVSVAQRLDRRWVGIDITHLAITLIRSRLRDAFGKEVEKGYKVIGEPASVFDAVALAQQDRYQFQWWALSLVGACPVPPERKKGADKGIDGRLYFHDNGSGKAKQIIFSVKSGTLKADDVRALLGVVERDGAAIGVLLTLHDPTDKMLADAAGAGSYVSPFAGAKCPRIQILTVEE
ncbi:MAG TPA: DNA methyltransferase, partial [Gemmataceae bacterium]|nr:DNA methyltransferase [Gemmataceae bacterium]